MNARNGKIARLPRLVRDELNERLECSEESPQLLAWLNALPEVKKIVQKNFAGVPISKQNLSEWRQGGFQEWLARQNLCAGIQSMEDFTQELEPTQDNVLADDVATVLAARYAALLTQWDGEVDEKFEAKTRALNRICRSVVQLQRSMHQAKKANEDYFRTQEEEQKRLEEREKKFKLDQVWAIRREPQVAQLFGGGELGRKLAKYIVALENDVPGAKLEATGREKPDPELVPPIPKKRTAKKPSKTTIEKVDKPLAAKDLEAKEGAKIGEEESTPVKVGQSDLAGNGGGIECSRKGF